MGRSLVRILQGLTLLLALAPGSADAQVDTGPTQLVLPLLGNEFAARLSWRPTVVQLVQLTLVGHLRSPLDEHAQPSRSLQRSPANWSNWDDGGALSLTVYSPVTFGALRVFGGAAMQLLLPPTGVAGVPTWMGSVRGGVERLHGSSSATFAEFSGSTGLDGGAETRLTFGERMMF